jgi:hypothetical protein
MLFARRGFLSIGIVGYVVLGGFVFAGAFATILGTGGFLATGVLGASFFSFKEAI